MFDFMTFVVYFTGGCLTSLCVPSTNFVDAAKQMQNVEVVRFNVPIEADIHEEVLAVHEQGVDDKVRSKVNFFQGDACQIGEMGADGRLGKYDGVIMSNLLCRLPDPLKCLNGLPRVVNKGGVVVLVTPFSWLEQFTPRGKWLGGIVDPVTKEACRSKDELHLIMEERGFEKIFEDEMPLVIREHQRKYQYIVSEATGWRKKV
jgi:SAM-dependent methyltransferase